MDPAPAQQTYIGQQEKTPAEFKPSQQHENTDASQHHKWSRDSFLLTHSGDVQSTPENVERLDQLEAALLTEGTVWDEEKLRKGLRHVRFQEDVMQMGEVYV